MAAHPNATAAHATAAHVTAAHVTAAHVTAAKVRRGGDLTWSVGITTAPRRRPTLERTVESLRGAGWDRPRLFADAGCDLPESLSALPATRHDERLGAFSNWHLALAELVFRAPDAGVYLLCQDDVLFSRGLRVYLERSLWPGPRVGVVSLHCPSHLSEGRAAGYHALDLGWSAWGAQAYAFPNEAAFAFLADALPLAHRRRGPRGGSCNIDSVVGLWCRLRNRPYYVHVPSLAQHVGETSTLWAGATTNGRRRASDFVASVDELPADAT